MSSFDDEEALFEDIYDDDKPTESSKPTEAPEKQENEELKSTPEPSTENTSAVPPPSVPAPAAAPAPTASESAPVDLLQGIPAHLKEQFEQFQRFQAMQQQQQPGSAPAPPPPPPAQNYNPQPHSEVGKGTGKMFIGGLNWDTTEEKLVAYFSKFGKVSDYTIMRDSATGRSRGFGFLTFEDPKSVDEVIKSDHVLDGKLIDPKRAIAREEQDKVGKIFVGGIDPMVNEKEFDEFFSQFGQIIDCQLMIDKDTGRSRGFGFITYDSPDAVDRVCVNKYLTLKGKAMEVKRAEPRGQHQQNQMQPQAQYNPYGNQYGTQAAQANPYAQSMNGMSPEMMQEYWQRMQQWYMYQGQQQGQDENGEGQEQPQQPLNPQQQEAETQEAPAAENNNRSYGNGQNNSNGYSRGDRDSSRGHHGHGGHRKFNGAPRGPRRGGPPSGPGGSGRGRGGYRNRDRGGYHPYSRGGRR